MKIAKQSVELQYAWAAGLLEGEGCFSIFKRKDRRNTCSVAILCEMTDRDTVESLQKVFNVGTVVERPNISGRVDRRTRKPTYIWSVQNKVGVLEVLLRVMPFLHTRRLAKAHELLEHIETVGYDG